VCVSCGCALPATDHGDHRHITAADLRGAADAANTTVGCVAHNIESFAMHHPAEAQKTVEDMANAVEEMTVAVVKAEDAQRFLLMVGYSPNRLPKRGADGFLDVASPEVVEKAAWRFMLNGHGAGLMHKAGGEDAFRIVESSVYRNPEPWVVKATDGTEQTIREGDWLIGILCSPDTWAEYKKGRYGSGSLQGGARRRQPRAETLARQRSA